MNVELSKKLTAENTFRETVMSGEKQTTALTDAKFFTSSYHKKNNPVLPAYGNSNCKCKTSINKGC